MKKGRRAQLSLPHQMGPDCISWRRPRWQQGTAKGLVHPWSYLPCLGVQIQGHHVRRAPTSLLSSPPFWSSVLTTLDSNQKSNPPEHTTHFQPLTHIGPAESFPQWPGPQVHSLSINSEWLHTALKASVCPCCSHQPVSTGSSTKIERCPEGNFTVLAL